MTVVLSGGSRDTERINLALAEEVSILTTPHELAEYLVATPDEDLIITGPDVAWRAVTDLSERYRLERPALGVIAIRPRLELQAISEAMRSGVRDVVGADDAEALQAACARSRHLTRQMRDAESRGVVRNRGRVITVFSAKGGVGRTTVATNLAQAMVSQEGKRVCLVDLNGATGDVGIVLRAEPSRTLADALGMQGGLDEHAVASIVLNNESGIDLLLAPTAPADAEFVTAGLVSELLGLLTTMYDVVIIDPPTTFDDTTLRVFDLTDSFVLVGSLDIAALKNLKLSLDTLDALGYPRSRSKVVLNRSDSRVGLTPTDFEDVIGASIVVNLPSSRSVPDSMNRGQTLFRSEPRHAFSKSISTLARTEAGEVPSWA